MKNHILKNRELSKMQFFVVVYVFPRVKCQMKCNFIFLQAEAIRENIGYPEYLTNKTALAKMFKGVSIFRKSFFNLSSLNRPLEF